MDSNKNRLSMNLNVIDVCILSTKDLWIKIEVRLPITIQESSITVIRFDS